MRRFQNRAAAGAAGLALLATGLAGIPALGQDKPESILPPGFGEPTPTPAPTSAPSPSTSLPRPNVIPETTGDTSTAPPVAALDGNVSDAALPTAPVDPAELAKYELPDFARRSPARAGVIGVSEGGLPANAFGDANGRYLETLMRRLNAPVPSRWLSIGLRRALASQLDAPPGVGGADFVAERAWLLLRMGESIVARSLVQSIDNDRFTPKLYQVAMQAALAAGDPGALCPIVEQGRVAVHERGWILAGAMCAGLSGSPKTAGPLIDSARRAGVARGIDLLLAEKVVGAGSRGQRAVTIEWDGVDRLTVWRYGLAVATGVDIPTPLFATAAGHVQYWRAQAPSIDPRLRAPSAELAAAQGVLSNAALVDLYGEIDESDDQTSAEAGIARDLRNAYVDGDRDARLTALRQLWDEPRQSRGKYARLVLTARAAARIEPAANTADADRLVASMLSAGLETQARRWQPVVARGSDGWAMLLLADPNATTALGRSDIGAYQSRAVDPGGVKARMLFAGLAGLQRIERDRDAVARSFDIDLAAANSWTRALDRAVARRQPATVLLLAAVGMQTTDWRGVSPEALYHIVSALHRVGLEGEARMIAVEALTRL